MVMLYKAIFFFMIMFLCLVIVGTFQPTRAHSWYPEKCCSDDDCSVATGMFFNKDGSMTFTSRHGTAVLPFDEKYKIQRSEDNNWHVCMIPGYDRSVPLDRGFVPQMRILCVFAPEKVS